MQSYLQAGQLEQLTGFLDLNIQADSESYIPAFPLSNKSNEVRLVFEGSAKYHGISLNDCHYAGPDELNKLIGVICRFRKHEVGLAADIERMFHAF